MKEKDIIDCLLLDWLRGHYGLEKNYNKQELCLENIGKTEAFLKKYDITNLTIMSQSQDYYTLQYYQNQSPQMKQFKVEDVERYL
ncbi:hypothetical protein [Natronincola ferrireducens]|uniref:Uncharacterized protein n=1 Tax=Natronincola ferrireducens TaxID=393762 RepID=A0A1G9IJB1_9FIRM|nr:hypothetical protein [Natronincola ferrireducens]SDL25369.1 hypothetical protein SAMN05660472_02892 [Natronincola ferrireducens]